MLEMQMKQWVNCANIRTLTFCSTYSIHPFFSCSFIVDLKHDRRTSGTEPSWEDSRAPPVERWTIFCTTPLKEYMMFWWSQTYGCWPCQWHFRLWGLCSFGCQHLQVDEGGVVMETDHLDGTWYRLWHMVWKAFIDSCPKELISGLLLGYPMSRYRSRFALFTQKDSRNFFKVVVWVWQVKFQTTAHLSFLVYHSQTWVSPKLLPFLLQHRWTSLYAKTGISIKCVIRYDKGL